MKHYCEDCQRIYVCEDGYPLCFHSIKDRDWFTLDDDGNPIIRCNDCQWDANG